MKITKLLILLILFSLQAGATGYSHNMFVAHKKLQAGKECRTVQEQVTVRKASVSKVQPKAAAVLQERQSTISFSDRFAKLSGVATLNQRIVEEGPSSLFLTNDVEENNSSMVTRLVGAVKGLVFAFIKSTSLGRA